MKKINGTYYHTHTLPPHKSEVVPSPGTVGGIQLMSRGARFQIWDIIAQLLATVIGWSHVCELRGTLVALVRMNRWLYFLCGRKLSNV